MFAGRWPAPFRIRGEGAERRERRPAPAAARHAPAPICATSTLIQTLGSNGGSSGPSTTVVHGICARGGGVGVVGGLGVDAPGMRRGLPREAARCARRRRLWRGSRLRIHAGGACGGASGRHRWRTPGVAGGMVLCARGFAPRPRPPSHRASRHGKAQLQPHRAPSPQGFQGRGRARGAQPPEHTGSKRHGPLCAGLDCPVWLSARRARAPARCGWGQAGDGNGPPPAHLATLAGCCPACDRSWAGLGQPGGGPLLARIPAIVRWG